MTTLASPAARVDAPPSHRKRTEPPSVYARYVGAMLYFVGAALIAGAVVHYPLDPPVYAIICIVGAFVFLLGTVVNEFLLAAERPTLRRAISLVTFSLLLSFGVGMLGGGIQHFEAFPHRSAAMTPIGLVMSYLAFVAKDPEGHWRNIFGKFGASIALLAAVTWFGMSALADSLASAPHDHGTSQPSGQHTDAPGKPAPAEMAPERAPTSTAKAPAKSEHDSHGH